MGLLLDSFGFWGFEVLEDSWLLTPAWLPPISGFGCPWDQRMGTKWWSFCRANTAGVSFLLARLGSGGQLLPGEPGAT